MNGPQNRPYNDYNSYLKYRLGAKTYKVSISAGFSCPNIDGSVARGGCTYCNNKAFVPQYLSPGQEIRHQIREGINRQSRRYKAGQFLAYFQSYSNTYGPVEELERLYKTALRQDGIAGLIVGTRADCLEDEKLDLLEYLARDHYVALEVGIESVFDHTLKRINRGHTFGAVEDAFRRARGRGLDLGGHFIYGLPGENRYHWMKTVDVMNRLELDYTKLHHLHIVKGTQLAASHRKRPLPVFAFEEWISLVADMLEKLHPGIAIARMAGSAPPDLLIAPDWGGKHHGAVKDKVSQALTGRGTKQGSFYRSELI